MPSIAAVEVWRWRRRSLRRVAKLIAGGLARNLLLSRLELFLEIPEQIHGRHGRPY
jgi:hypothetical protein